MDKFKLSTKEKFLLICLSFLVFCFAIAMDLYLPFLPVMKIYFLASQLQMQFTLTLFIFCFGLSQLFFGPIIDKKGEKYTALLGAVVYIISCYLTIFVTHIYIFIFLRIIQSLGGAAMLVSAYSITNKLFSTEKAGKVFNYLAGAIAFSPLLGPIIGSYLGTLYEWPICFYFLTLIGIISFLITLFMIPNLTPIINKGPVFFHTIMLQF